MRVGITDYAQDALGDVVFVQVPAVGDRGHGRRHVRRGREHEVGVRHLRPGRRARSSRSTRRWPTRRRLLNEDPYGDGWICTIQMSDPTEFDALLDAAAYRALIEG